MSPFSAQSDPQTTTFPTSAEEVLLPETTTYQNIYKDCLSYIDSYWNEIIHNPEVKKLNEHTVILPFHYISPNNNKFSNLFYWDTFFIFRGLIGTPRAWLMRETVNNFIYFFNKYQLIPNFSAPGGTGRSQSPFLTSMILDTYYEDSRIPPKKTYLHKTPTPPKQWLKNAILTAHKEYEQVWIDKEGLFNHSIPGRNLSKYGDRDIGYAYSSELESGWDFTSRFYNRCNDFLPIDLNSYLFKYETDFVAVAKLLGETTTEGLWQKKANARSAEINDLMWNKQAGFFFDYDYADNKQSSFYSLAGFTPLWAGLATAEQARAMVEKLSLFETDYGLTITDKDSLAPPVNLGGIQTDFSPAIKAILEPKQWDYPNIWPPLEYLTVIGLLKYGYVIDATRIIKKSLIAQQRIFRKYGTLFEKMDGFLGDQSKDYTYKTQSGFGWTNAIFYRYVQLLDDISSGKDIYKKGIQNTPYELAILY